MFQRPSLTMIDDAFLYTNNHVIVAIFYYTNILEYIIIFENKAYFNIESYFSTLDELYEQIYHSMHMKP